MAAADGDLSSVDEADREFPIQSLSRPFVYWLAIDDRGPAEVTGKVGVERSGDAVNSIVMDERDNHPVDPMVNARAIAGAARIRGPGYAPRTPARGARDLRWRAADGG